MWQAAMWEPASRSASGPSVQSALVAEQAQLARLRRQVDERWRALAVASANALPDDDANAVAALERLYDVYMRAVESYVTRQRALNRPRERRQRAS